MGRWVVRVLVDKRAWAAWRVSTKASEARFIARALHEERVVPLVVVNSCRTCPHCFDHASMLIAVRRPLAAKAWEIAEDQEQEQEEENQDTAKRKRKKKN